MSKNRNSGHAYVIRNFWRLLFVGLPISILLALFYGLRNEVKLFKDYFAGQLQMDNYMQEVMEAFSVTRFADTWWIIIILLVVFVLTMSLYVCMISKHMKTGEMPLFPLRPAINIAPTMAAYLLAMAGLMEVLSLVTVGVSYLLQDHAANIHVAIWFTAGLQFLFTLLCSYIFGLLLLAFPIKVTENYSFNVALSYSARTMSSHPKFMLRQSFVYPIGRVLVIALGVLLPEVVGIVLMVIFHLYYVMIIPAFSYSLYYIHIGGDRRDLTKHLYF
ncbi:MAG: hypothetical protein IJF66_04335 [Clostridia bacterium]|nr:hypothetical protein [Clostridia bacterium]